MSILKRYNGTSWETVNTGTNVVGGLGGQLISSQTLASASSTITFSNLDSLVDGDYTIEFNAFNNGSTGRDLRVYINGDTTDANYKMVLMSFNSSYADGGTGGLKTYASVPAFTYLQASGTVTGELRLVVANGYYTCYCIETSTVQSTGYMGIGNRTISKLTGSISSITSISIICGSAGTPVADIKAGSTFRLYGSNIATNLIDYTPINYSNFTEDRLLKAGEMAYIDYSAATSVLLHIATVEGLYTLDILGDNTVTVGTLGTVVLSPNNTTTSAGDIDSLLIYGTMTPSDASGAKTIAGYKEETNTFRIGLNRLIKSTSNISTTTKSKSIFTTQIGISTTTYQTDILTSNWNNTSTAWTSLGTITFPFAQTGKILVKRII